MQLLQGDGIGRAGHIQEDVLGVVDGWEEVGFLPMGQMGVEAGLGREGGIGWDEGHELPSQAMVGSDAGRMEASGQRGDADPVVVVAADEQD